jgi:hypothetical protein
VRRAVAPKVRPVRQELAPYDPRSEPAKTVGILVAGFALLQLGAGGGGLALAGRRHDLSGGARGSSGGSGSGSGGGGGGSGSGQVSPQSAEIGYEGVEIEYIGAGFAGMAIGDRSRTYRWPGTQLVDRVAIYLGTRLAPRSPLLARVITDGTWTRTIFGSASQILPLGGLVLGILALRNTGGDPVPPVAGLTIAIAAISVLDAGAGIVAVLTFLIGVLLHGQLDTNAELRLMLGLGALWSVVPVLTGAARPLRRDRVRGLAQTWDRAADFVIGSLVGAWAVQQIVLALPGLAGRQLAIGDHADVAALCVLAALVVRLGLETIAAHLYPARVGAASPSELPDPGRVQRLGATALRAALFVFLGNTVVGHHWQLWVGAALFVIPQILSVYEDLVPNSPALFRALPKGILELVLMLLVGTAVGALLIATMNEHASTFLANSFILLMLPGFVLSLIGLFGRDGDEPELGWGKRLAGVPILIVGILLALGLLL